LERIVTFEAPGRRPRTQVVIEFDASPWGGGAARRTKQGYDEWFALTWTPDMVQGMDVAIGEARSQSFWEFFTLLLCLLTWCSEYPGHTLQVVGDNTASLQAALSLKARGPMLAVAREISWRRARYDWAFGVGHLPTESNQVADALSRLVGPEAVPLPAVLRSVRRRAAPNTRDLLQALAEE